MEPEFVRELVDAFLRDAEAALTDLRATRAAGRAAAWRRIAHKFRGSCATVGARGMMEITSRMEALDQADLDARAVAQLDELEAEFRRVERALLSQGSAGSPR